MAWMIGVAVFVSLPFTTYALLAGLSHPAELSTRRRGSTARPGGAATGGITLPLLRPALWSPRSST